MPKLTHQWNADRNILQVVQGEYARVQCICTNDDSVCGEDLRHGSYFFVLRGQRYRKRAISWVEIVVRDWKKKNQIIFDSNDHTLKKKYCIVNHHFPTEYIKNNDKRKTLVPGAMPAFTPVHSQPKTTSRSTTTLSDRACMKLLRNNGILIATSSGRNTEITPVHRTVHELQMLTLEQTAVITHTPSAFINTCRFSDSKCLKYLGEKPVEPVEQLFKIINYKGRCERLQLWDAVCVKRCKGLVAKSKKTEDEEESLPQDSTTRSSYVPRNRTGMRELTLFEEFVFFLYMLRYMRTKMAKAADEFGISEATARRLYPAWVYACADILHSYTYNSMVANLSL